MNIITYKNISHNRFPVHEKNKNWCDYKALHLNCQVPGLTQASIFLVVIVIQKISVPIFSTAFGIPEIVSSTWKKLDKRCTQHNNTSISSCQSDVPKIKKLKIMFLCHFTILNSDNLFFYLCT